MRSGSVRFVAGIAALSNSSVSATWEVDLYQKRQKGYLLVFVGCFKRKGSFGGPFPEEIFPYI